MHSKLYQAHPTLGWAFCWYDGKDSFNSPKYLNSVVGHEITHVLEGTEMYGELQKVITEYRSELKKLLQAIDPTGDNVVSNYDPMGSMGYPSMAWYNRALSATVDSIYDSSESDSEILVDIANSGATTKTVVEKARELFGYDGYNA